MYIVGEGKSQSSKVLKNLSGTGPAVHRSDTVSATSEKFWQLQSFFSSHGFHTLLRFGFPMRVAVHECAKFSNGGRKGSHLNIETSKNDFFFLA